MEHRVSIVIGLRPTVYLVYFRAIFARKRDEVHLSFRYLLVVLPDPYSAFSVGGSLGRAHFRAGLAVFVF